MEYQAPNVPVDMHFSAHYCGPGLDFKQEYSTTLQPDWIWSYHQSGYGFDEPGNWSPGNYTVTIYLWDEKLTESFFCILNA